MRATTRLTRILVRQRPSYRQVVIPLVEYVEQQDSTVLMFNQHVTVIRRPSSSVTVANEDRVPVHSSSSSLNNLPQNETDNSNNLPVRLIDFTAASKIEGEESHIATVTLHPGETLRAESGSMIYMTEGVVLDTKLSGISSAFNRMLTGQNLFLTDFRYDGAIGTTGTVCLGTTFPSKILRLTLADHPNQNLICQKGAYMASNPNIQIEMEFTKTMTAGFFGGQGFILQKISGDTDVLIKGGGTIINKQLRDGETLRVTSGSLVCFESTVSYDVQMVPGITNAMFGGEGLFMTTLQGPGQVWLQGMPPENMIAEIASRMPRGGLGFGIPIPIGGGGGVGDAAGGVAGADDIASGGAAAASEAAIEADRAATVASSGIASTVNVDAESPSALFGDTLSPSQSNPSSDTLSAGSPSSEFYDSVPKDQPTFEDSSIFSTDSSESTFDDEFSVDDEQSNDSINDGELFDDNVGAASENVVEESQSMFRKIWDFFSDQD